MVLCVNFYPHSNYNQFLSCTIRYKMKAVFSSQDTFTNRKALNTGKFTLKYLI